MNSEQYIEKKRAEVASIAEKVLKNEMNILLASRKLSHLRHEIDIDEQDEDFKIFTVIDSETDSLPLDDEQKNWNQKELKNKEKEIQKSEDWAKRIGGLDSCMKIFDRFKKYI